MIPLHSFKRYQRPAHSANEPFSRSTFPIFYPCLIRVSSVALNVLIFWLWFSCELAQPELTCESGIFLATDETRIKAIDKDCGMRLMSVLMAVSR